ncbi:MAG: hypothetical protein AB7G88_00200 [Thermomicrobiales bacterium]
MTKRPPLGYDRDGHRDFDFLHDCWTVRNRRLNARFQNGTGWGYLRAVRWDGQRKRPPA